MILNLYQKELERKRKEHQANCFSSGEEFYLLAGRSLTLMLYHSIQEAEQRVSFDSILMFYKMDTDILYNYIWTHEFTSSELELSAIKMLSIRVLRKVQDENLIILERMEHN